MIFSRFKTRLKDAQPIGLPHSNSPSAFTLVELLVVISIIGILISLLLPVIQAARGAALRNSCANNLQQWGIALQNHHDSLRRFPPGRGTPTPRIFSLFAPLLSFTEEAALAQRIDFQAAPADFSISATVSYSGTKNLPAAATSVPILLCPADRAAGNPSNAIYASTNYAGNAGDGTTAGLLTKANGIFFLGSGIRLRDVTVGTSKTVAISERTLGTLSSDPNELQRSSFREHPGAVDPTASLCADLNAGSWNHERGGKWIVGNYGNTLYNHALLPNSSAADCTNATQQKGRFAARCDHAAGAQAIRCDGSVTFVSDEISITVWQAAATRAGNELGGVID